MIAVSVIDEKIVSVGTGDVLVDELPRNVGLERLRVVDGRVVDLARLDVLHVVPLPQGGFEFFASPRPGSQPVRMRWEDRSRLRVGGDGAIRVITREKEEAERAAMRARHAARKALRAIVDALGDEAGAAALLLVIGLAYALRGDVAARAAMAVVLDDVVSRAGATPAVVAEAYADCISDIVSSLDAARRTGKK